MLPDVAGGRSPGEVGVTEALFHVQHDCTVNQPAVELYVKRDHPLS
jgi:hypothetical protein